MILYVLHDLMGSSSWMEQPPTSKEPGQAVPLPQTLFLKICQLHSMWLHSLAPMPLAPSSLFISVEKKGINYSYVPQLWVFVWIKVKAYKVLCVF